MPGRWVPGSGDRLFYFEVLIYYQMEMITVTTSRRVAHGRRAHHEAVMNPLSGFGYASIALLQQLLDGARAWVRAAI